MIIIMNIAVVITSLTLSQEGGGLLQPPFRIFPRTIFAKIAIRSIYPPFVQIPMYLWKNFSKIFAVEKVGGWGGAS